MNILKFTLLSLALLASPALRADPAPVLAPVPPSSPVADPLAEALPILQAHYPDFPALDYKPGDKLGDLITRSKGEISLVTPDTLAPTPILTATLPDSVVYWRLASFTPKKDWNELGRELQNDGQHGAATGAILDLRSNEAPEDMQGAAQVASFFAPGDSSLKRYNVKTVDGTLVSNELVFAPHFNAPLIVLTDQRTSGAAEVLAACLKADGALVVGEQTSGRGAAFADWKLSSGQILRFVVDHVRLSDGVDLWNHPVIPDISPTENNRNESAALTLIRDNHVFDVIQESEERHRLSEATLVQGQDPELDEYLATLERKPVLLSLPIIHDSVLISALDSLKAIRLSQRTLPSPVNATSSAAVSLPASTSIQ
jgi:hypothetical protein